MSNITISKSDFLGAFASGLCLIHCIATPFIFVAQACAVSCCASTPTWWIAIDYLFAGVSFFAIYWSVQTTSKNWMKYALWIAWMSLIFVIINEKTTWIYLTHNAIFVPSVGLILLHLYNREYCQYADKDCCAAA